MIKLKKLFVTGIVVTTISVVGASSVFAASNSRLDYMQSMMQQRVEQGYMTQEQADYMYEYMQKNGTACHRLSGEYNGQGMMGGRGMMNGYNSMGGQDMMGGYNSTN